ncbi:Virulence sensor histidine kinase PhoQ [Methyloligella halotolerans]|uniref:histidine kinase n=1 Tax=Methyloligella halotolerans TaxID=1177755 RepID=A0A1E2RY34_9HYPH|nr:HAMP domain-containing sensor histidine kinase [Methyloligella halotolerans]ODA67147.1 Virulence sensor histidine kinase PhoQ [Methyloligella halotolerans]
MSRGSLRWRLLLAGAVSSLVAVLVAAALLTLLFQRHVARSADNELTVHLDQLIAGLGRGADGGIAVIAPPGDSRFSEPLSGLYWEVKVAPDGPVYRSRSLWDFTLALPVSDNDGSVHQVSLEGPGDTDLHGLQRSVVLPQRLGGGTVEAVVALDATELQSATRRFATILVPSLMLIGLLLGAAAFAQVTIGLRPLKTMRKRLAAIRDGRAERLGETYPDEVQPLATEIDSLLAARADQVETARRRAADLAHGLKTSLQVLSGEARSLREKGESEAADNIELLTGAMQRHVERQLARARLAPQSAAARADLMKVVHTVRSVVERTPRGAELQWSVDIPEGLTARIDEQDLAEALGNLLENAARHARKEVRIAAHPEGGAVQLNVADDGPGIPEAQFDAVLRRGGRSTDRARGQGWASPSSPISQKPGAERCAWPTNARAWPSALSCPWRSETSLCANRPAAGGSSGATPSDPCSRWSRRRPPAARSPVRW